MKCRKNIKRLTADEKKRFVNAILGLKSQDSVIRPGVQSRYDDFAETHMNAMMAEVRDINGNLISPGWAHSDSVFFPWHRELLYQFEKLLQTVDSSVMIPYWDWTRERTTANSGFPFTNDIIAGNGDSSDSFRVKRDPAAPAVTAMNPYIYPFDPELWQININDGDGLTFFQRAFNGNDPVLPPTAPAPTLPTNTGSVVGTGIAGNNFRAAINGGNTYINLRQRSEDLHNLVHRWIGGNMLRMTSPNDPVFFMHHAQIDRMWSLWQKKVAPGTNLFVQSSSLAGHKLNDAMLFNDTNPAPFPTGATIAQMINGHSMHGDGVWYDSDLPEIDNPAPSLDFTNIPEGLTSFKAVRFKIKGCRTVKFKITGDPTGQFGITTMGRDFVADPVESDDFYYGFVWVKVAAIAGAIPNSSVAIHAYITDDEGYYAATEGGEFALGDYTVVLTATSVPRANNSIALVLDRSGSMDAPAGGTSTRSQLLGNAIEVFRTLMLPNDEVSVVTFDDVVATAIPMQVVSGTPSFNTVDITPRNMTWIGGGIQQGVIQLAAANHTNRAMVVLTDGNENVHPYIGELPSGTITNRTYAIGFGLPGEVSDPVLNQITSNTHGDLIITGNMPSEEQRFNLTKYFVQILAGITNSQVILDPNGKLFFGSNDQISFKVTEADVYLDVITLSPLPKYIDFILKTPGGKLIKPSSVEPNVQFIMGEQVMFYRMVLPALANDASGSHAGTWNALLSLKTRDTITKFLSNQKFANSEVSPKVNAFLPYSFLVHATSNLQFNAWRIQESFVPGAIVHLFAMLKEYDVVMKNRATVWAEIIQPDQNSFMKKMVQGNDGLYTADFKTVMAGVYVCRLMAEGNSGEGVSFTREKTVTAGVYYGNYDPVPKPNPGDLLCDLLHCMFEEHEVFTPAAFKRLRELGIDLKAFIKCVEEVCPAHAREVIEGLKEKEKKQLRSTKQAVRQLVFKNLNKARQIKVKKIVVAAHKKHPNMEAMKATMFMPVEPGKEIVSGKSSKVKKALKGEEHLHSNTRHMMFMPLDPEKETKFRKDKGGK